MLPVPNSNLWLGNVADLRDIRSVLATGVTAIVDLAIEEPIPELPRTLTYCRFLISDDGENDEFVLRAAIVTAAELLQGNAPVAICCNAGLNRSPALAAIALARARKLSPAKTLPLIGNAKNVDINPALWNQMLGSLRAMDGP